VRRFTPVELAIGVALLGSLVAVVAPAFVRELHASRFVEPTDGLSRLGTAAIVYAEENERFPDSAPLTPASPPRGKKEADPPNMWDGPTWKALAFRPTPEGVPHAYSFSFESTAGGAAFVAQARGDLDGDGVLSLFEIRGHARRGENDKASVQPGMYIEAELE
jgi:type II secretory pathway pseudopilin PulG